MVFQKRNPIIIIDVLVLDWKKSKPVVYCLLIDFLNCRGKCRQFTYCLLYANLEQAYLAKQYYVVMLLN